ncbi:MAG: rhodanese-like domain-containing protein [Verrucomicrobia bacterium]|jgi:rhodanese-related sulfurtransferase|nr:rhodanese-like domain-containing protein [Verrucomicrobiota bacterium]
MNLIALGLLLLAGLFFFGPRLRWLKVSKASRLLARGAHLVDVRSRREFREHRIPGAVNCPVGEVGREVRKELGETEKPLVLFCQSGVRSAAAVRRLRQLGYGEVYNLGTYARARRAFAEAREDEERAA